MRINYYLFYLIDKKIKFLVKFSLFDGVRIWDLGFFEIEFILLSCIICVYLSKIFYGWFFRVELEDCWCFFIGLWIGFYSVVVKFCIILFEFGL